MGTQAAGGGPERGDSASLKGVPQRAPCEAAGETAVHGEAGLHRPRNPQVRGGGCHSRGSVPRMAGKPRRCAKKCGKERMCVDFTNLNKACPQDPFPLPRIDQIVDSTAECDLLCFLDAFSGYHQIKMAVEDVEKTAFLTPCGVYCYTCMPFGLRNAGATFQRLMHITLGRQLGRNTEAYVDDIVVKSREAWTLIQDLEETFESLR